MAHAVTAPPLVVEEMADRVVVTFSRPAVHNAISLDTVDALHSVLGSVEQDPRFLIFTATPGVFVGGADVRELVTRDAHDALDGINLRVFDRLARAPLPTIAAIDGPALGGGAELAYACDLRLVTPNAVFGQPEPGVGIAAAAGAMWRLPQLVGVGLAKDVLFAGRRIGGDEATRIGLASKVVLPDDLVAEAHRLVDRMAAMSADALRFMKVAIDAGPCAHPTVDLLAQAYLFETEEKRRRMTEFIGRGP